MERAAVAAAVAVVLVVVLWEEAVRGTFDDETEGEERFAHLLGEFGIVNTGLVVDDHKIIARTLHFSEQHLFHLMNPGILEPFTRSLNVSRS